MNRTLDEEMYYEINANILPQIRLVDTAVLEPPYVHRRRQPDEYILYIMKQGVLYLREEEKNMNSGKEIYFCWIRTLCTKD
ncbi:MAG: hypothetical protein ACLRMZ_03045 [Blautia marasmi]